MCDFTGLVHLRHAYELGGVWWALTMVLNPVLTMLAGWVYCAHFDASEGGASKLDRTLVFAVLGAPVGLWAAALIAFALTASREHLRTFLAPENGRQFARRLFWARAGGASAATR